MKINSVLLSEQKLAGQVFFLYRTLQAIFLGFSGFIKRFPKNPVSCPLCTVIVEGANFSYTTLNFFFFLNMQLYKERPQLDTSD